MVERPSLVITNHTLTESALAAALGRPGAVPYLFRTLHEQVVACVGRMPKRMPGFVRRHQGELSFAAGGSEIVLQSRPRGIAATVRREPFHLRLEIELFEDQYVGRIDEIRSSFLAAEAMLHDLKAGWPAVKTSLLA